MSPPRRASGPFYLEIFVVSLAVILLEISFTRVFSFKLFYYFTYLIIGISLLGIGSGGVFTAISGRLRSIGPSRLIPACCFVAGAVILGGYFAIAKIQLNSAGLPNSLLEDVKLVVICTLLFVPFLMAGTIIATIFTADPARVPRLYFSDLVGAGLGCALSVPCFYLLTPPGTVFLSGFAFVIAGVPLARKELRRALVVAIPLGAVLLVGALAPGRLPDPVVDELKTMSPQRIGTSRDLFSRWSPVFRIDVMESAYEPDSRRIINHDGMMGSTIHRFDGNPASLRKFEGNSRSNPFRILRPQPKVLIIGAAGGHEILASLYFGAAHVTAVELNPATVALLTTDFADYSGHLAENERVTLVNAEGRSFLKRDDTKYDLIWFVAPDSYAAMNSATSGAYVLSESYLYTSEMIEESLSHLTDDGIICMSFGEIDFIRKPNRTARYLSSARLAFANIGIPDFPRHVAVVTAPSIFLESQMLLKKAPFTPDEIARLTANVATIKDGRIQYAFGVPMTDHPVHRVIAANDEALARWYREYPYDVRAITDDAPFFWHFARFKDAMRGTALKMAGWDMEDATGERVLLVLLVAVIALATVFLLLPFVTIRRIWSQIPYKLPAAVYFAALGMGFMFFEISLIQKLTLFLGYPTYSLTVTLFTLLVFTGLGSLASQRYGGSRNRAVMVLLVALTVLMVFYQFGLGWMANRWIGVDFGLRVAMVVACLAPLGLCLGAFMPLGIATIAATTPHQAEFIAWAWAVNGFFSVISSILVTILSMTFGFTIVLLLAVLVYVVGVTALLRIPAPTPA